APAPWRSRWRARGPSWARLRPRGEVRVRADGAAGPPRARPPVPPAPRAAAVFPPGGLVAGAAGGCRPDKLGPPPPGPRGGGGGRAGGARGVADRPGARGGPDRAAAGGAGVPDGGVPAATVCVAGGGWPGALDRPRPAGHGAAQLRGGGPGGRPGVSPRAAL